MGAVLARAWSEPDFTSRIESDPNTALAELAIAIPAGLDVVVKPCSDRVVHLVLGAPPIVVSHSPLSDIEAFACIYRVPALWSLNWLGRDPVAAQRFLEDPAALLERCGVAVPEGLTVEGAANGPYRIHLVLPPTPPADRLTPALFDHLRAGRVPAALRFGRLFGQDAYRLLLDRLATPPARQAA